MNFLNTCVATVLIVLIIKPDSTVDAVTTLILKNMMGFKIKFSFITSDGRILSIEDTLEKNEEKSAVVNTDYLTIAYIHIKYYFYFIWITDNCPMKLRRPNYNCNNISSNWFTGCRLIDTPCP